MKHKCKSKLITLSCLTLACSMLFMGCSSDSKQTIQIIVGNSYVSQENLDACEEELLASYPDWQGEETEIEFTPIDFGDPETDPYAGASIAKVSAMVTAKEIDLMICDTENAARFARSEMFVPVEEVLSEEELAQYEDRLLKFETVDETGNLTGEFTQPCGISLTGDSRFDSIFGEQEYGVFLVANADPMENAEAIFKDLI